MERKCRLYLLQHIAYKSGSCKRYDESLRERIQEWGLRGCGIPMRDDRRESKDSEMPSSRLESTREAAAVLRMKTNSSRR